MLELYFKGIPTDASVVHAELAKKDVTGGFIPADFKQLAQLAILIASIDSETEETVVNASHVARAIEMIKITKGREEIIEEEPVVSPVVPAAPDPSRVPRNKR